MSATTKTKPKPSKATKSLIDSGIWDWILEHYGGRSACSILSVSNNNNDSKYLMDLGHLNVNWTDANNISAIPARNQFQVSIITYLNEIMSNEMERNNFLYEIGERTNRRGQIFISINKSSQIKLDMNEIIRDKTFTMYLI